MDLNQNNTGLYPSGPFCRLRFRCIARSPTRPRRPGRRRCPLS